MLQYLQIIKIYCKGGIHMKATGIVRQLDPLGRIVLPVELRRTLNINKDDPLEIFVDGREIIFKKYEPACVFLRRGKGN